VKKCASCSKDLPDAALHCVFCGAKQPPAPATTGGLAKTVMGSYSANDVMEQLKGGPAPRSGPGPTAPYGAQVPPRSAPGPTPGAPYAPPGSPRPVPGLTPAPPGATPMPPPGPGPAAPRPLPGVPAISSAAPTLYAAGPAPAGPQGGFGGPGPTPGPSGPNAKTVALSPPGGPAAPAGPAAPVAGAFKAGPGPVPFAPMPPSSPAPPPPLPAPMPQPYLSSRAADRSGRPVEPWKDSLRHQMFLWGVVLLAVFATPLTVDPLAFNWDTILHGTDDKAKLLPLIMAAVGLLGLLLALIPTSPAPRGLLAGLLGLAGIAAPLVLGEVTEWRLLATLGGTLLLIPGLLIREEYRESLLPRFMVTIGVLAVLVPMLLPENDRLPLVDLFKAAIDQSGKAKVSPLLDIAFIVLVVMTLLAWLPAPASGGAKVFAWILLLWPAVTLLSKLVLADQIVDAATKTPNSVVLWAVATAYEVLIGYGFASAIGKRLE
jgi:hypothetical protein